MTTEPENGVVETFIASSGNTIGIPVYGLREVDVMLVSITPLIVELSDTFSCCGWVVNKIEFGETVTGAPSRLVTREPF